MKTIKNLLAEYNCDALLLTDGYNIHYNSGYAGHEGYMLVTKDKTRILTDSRYTEQAGIEAPDCEIVDIGLDGYAKTVKRLLEESTLKTEDKKLVIGFENKHISYEAYKKLADTIGDQAELIELGDSVNKLRMVKCAEEIEKLARAEAIGDEAFSHICTVLKPGMTEREVALALEVKMRQLGATGLSFDTIAASGEHSSLPHAVPTDKQLARGEFLTMDFGCVYEGYCSDMTRTVFTGSKDEISDEQKKVYDTVLLAQTESLKHIRPGVSCKEVDKVARDIIAKAGYDGFFGHGLGHGVGLYIHEEPRLSQKCDEILQVGHVVTCEPGIYLPGKFGVRIEDMVVVTEDGYRNLASSPKELLYIS